MITRKYNLVNNIAGWVVFAIALATYWLTLEPTASYWDCGEFIIQADKLEIGHPPGNPIFMLTARFFANFASSPEGVALMVNAMSGLLSALTILLLYRTVTYLVRRLVQRDPGDEISLPKCIAIVASGVVGGLAYAWSDTFWFSAVEAEVYAFSSFCTALAFWLILKWESVASQPHSDRYLILIAYIIGVSVAVHLLNLLCIPAIALVFAFHKFRNMNLLKSLATLAVSFGVIVLVLYGLVPGFLKVAQKFELMFVNGMHCSFNTGTVVYAVLTLTAFCWSLYELYRQKNATAIRISFLLAVMLSGVVCFTHSAWVWLLLWIAVAAVLFVVFRRNLPVRILNVTMWSIAMIFLGCSSYALILIRSTADTPMNQNEPDNVFDLASYLNREQYGDNPLFYGETYNSGVQQRLESYDEIPMGENQGQQYTLYYPRYSSIVDYGNSIYAKGVKGADTPAGDELSPSEKARNKELAQRGGDHYVVMEHKWKPRMNPELNMFFPRIYSNQMPSHRSGYETWVPSLRDTLVMMDNMKDIYALDQDGNKIPELDLNGDYQITGVGTVSFPAKRVFRPTYGQNLEYFINYQLVHMYMRYFMWNFAGRQNDLMNQWGEMDAGNWISGIPAIDNARLGDQSLLPEELGKGNKGHNVFYFLPLILGLMGLLWQAFRGERGIQQFWVVFFLFFMTGIAIVIYLNQVPNQTRERDYAFAGSFYAFAIWIGMGVAALWRLLIFGAGYASSKGKASAGKSGDKSPAKETTKERAKESAREETVEKADKDMPSYGNVSLWSAIVAAALGIAVPLQMVSQTWDDHDRSGRYAARDYAIDYLESTEPNAIIFCNGDNDTFPLWYAQEVEGVRPDVRIINLSYLPSQWYASNLRLQAYESAPVPMTATPADYAYNKNQVVLINREESAPVNLHDALKAIYAGNGMAEYGRPVFPSSRVYVPIDKQLMVKRGYVSAADTARLEDRIVIDLNQSPAGSRGYVNLAELLMLDIIATNAAEGWERPIYWCTTVGTEYYMGLDPYQATTGMTLQLVPWLVQDNAARTDRAYNVITRKYRWGGGDAKGRKPYYDETATRMLSAIRGSMIATSQQLMLEGNALEDAGDMAGAKDKWKKALELVTLLEKRQGAALRPYSLQTSAPLAELFVRLGGKLGDGNAVSRGMRLMENLLVNYASYILYEQHMRLNFGNVEFTYNTKIMPYQYWGLVESYQDMGGDFGKLQKKYPVLTRLDLKTLQENWARYNGPADGAGDYMSAIREFAAIVVRMGKASPQEYAGFEKDYLEIDSTFYSIIDEPEAYGVDVDQVMEICRQEGVDLNRQKELYNKYKSAHRR